MGDDLKVDLSLRSLPQRAGINRIGGTPVSTEGEKSLKSLGDPLPRRADLADYPERLRQMFAYEGLLDVLKRKLNALTGEQYAIVPASGDRVCIDEQGRVHVGKEFLEENYGNDAVIAGVLAHEWGHFPTRRRQLKNLDRLPWEEIYRLRRHEETQADMFCGRALFLLRYPYEPLVAYLRRHEDPKEKSAKYHSVLSRARVIAASYHSQVQRNTIAHRIQLDDAVYGDPIHGSRLIGS